MTSQAKAYQSSNKKTNLQAKSIFKTTTETILQEVCWLTQWISKRNNLKH
jgi:hypothetical protein